MGGEDNHTLTLLALALSVLLIGAWFVYWLKKLIVYKKVTRSHGAPQTRMVDFTSLSTDTH